MLAKIITWKKVDILVNSDGSSCIYCNHEVINFQTLKDAFQYINITSVEPESLWDTIKRAVNEYKQKTRVYKYTYMGDDDRGIDNEMRLDLYYDGIHDFLKERKCLHLVFPSYYNCNDEAVVELN